MANVSRASDWYLPLLAGCPERLGWVHCLAGLVGFRPTRFVWEALSLSLSLSISLVFWAAGFFWVCHAGGGWPSKKYGTT